MVAGESAQRAGGRAGMLQSAPRGAYQPAWRAQRAAGWSQAASCAFPRLPVTADMLTSNLRKLQVTIPTAVR